MSEGMQILQLSCHKSLCVRWLLSFAARGAAEGKASFQVSNQKVKNSPYPQKIMQTSMSAGLGVWVRLKE